jgi:hypothetical protein
MIGVVGIAEVHAIEGDLGGSKDYTFELRTNRSVL